MNSRNLPKGAAFKVLRVPPVSVPLLSATSDCFDHKKGGLFCSFAPGPRKPSGGPDANV